MSISNNSINCGDDFTPAENREVNGDAISLDNDGQFDGKSETPITNHQQLKEFRENFAKLETELKMAKLELENKVLEQKLKHQELMVEQKALKEKVAKIEQKNEKNAFIDKFTHLENDQKKILKRIGELEKQQKKMLSMNQQNCWDGMFCHKRIELANAKCLTVVHHKGNENDWCSVFAKHSISDTSADSGNFYFEIGVEKGKYTYGVLFGIAVKYPMQLGENIRIRRDTYAYQCNGQFWINGARKDGNAEYYAGDVVGCGVNLATRQIIFTKNGHRLDTTNLAISSSFSADQGACEDGASSGARRRAEEKARRAPQAIDCGGPKGPANQSTACGSRADFFRSP
ncbi:hypothetical protein niasHS_005048 [Heterodera schachtii]|uniref:SPRY domain-containing protein n=1 Tax=Heterodera schachtii TaxID=97005 RepID=A0ABD2JKD2_HETSC